MRIACLVVGVLCWLIGSPVLAQSVVAPPSDHAAAVRALEAFIAAEVQRHRLPALSIALVDGRRVLWAKGFGHADPGRKTPATAETVYRVGSVSKLFTDLAVLLLVEKGSVDLDAPVSKVLPDFRVRNPFDRPITLRHLMAHRAGLVRESPVGSYFDGENTDLTKAIASLADTTLLHEPGTRTKYSNAGITVVGAALQKVRGQPFADCLREMLLDPLDMRSSRFEPTEAMRDRLAKARMWTYHGREFAAPTFEMAGIAPAGNLYSTVLDLARFCRLLMGKGTLDGKAIVRPETLERMWTVEGGGKQGFGLGFFVNQFQGRRRVGHDGAVYGFATQLAVLPDDQLGVVVAISCDCANAVASRIGEVALEHLLAVRDRKPLPSIASTQPLQPAEAARLAGRYEGSAGAFDLHASGERLYFWPGRGGMRLDLARQGQNLIADGRLSHGLKLEPIDGGFRIGKNDYRRVEPSKPAAVPARWLGLIGEYGPDHNILYVLEKDGKLHVLIEWFFLYPLQEESENVYRFPDFGLYPYEKLRFERDATGRATRVVAAGVRFERRRLDGEDGRTFRIKPVRPVEQLRREAARAKPPEEAGVLFRKSELVELTALDATIRLDVRYAGSNNFLGTPLYDRARAYLQKPAAEALVRVHRRLAERGLGLVVFDGYRPWSVTRVFWEATPPELRLFVADPSQGSRHNRGCAVDLSLYERASGKVVEMVGGYDEMSDRAYPDYVGGTSLQRWYRDLLRREMEKEGFTVYVAEWWHFDYKDWRKYPLGNESFADIEERAGR